MDPAFPVLKIYLSFDPPYQEKNNIFQTLQTLFVIQNFSYKRVLIPNWDQWLHQNLECSIITNKTYILLVVELSAIFLAEINCLIVELRAIFPQSHLLGTHEKWFLVMGQEKKGLKSWTGYQHSGELTTWERGTERRGGQDQRQKWKTHNIEESRSPTGKKPPHNDSPSTWHATITPARTSGRRQPSQMEWRGKNCSSDKSHMLPRAQPRVNPPWRHQLVWTGLSSTLFEASRLASRTLPCRFLKPDVTFFESLYVFSWEGQVGWSEGRVRRKNWGH